MLVSQSRAVVRKDIHSELRTRYGISALLLFSVTAVVLVVFAAAGEPVPRPIVSAMLWTVMVFTAMTGLGRAFVSEEERGTALFLRINSTPLAVYLGKLFTNAVIATIINLFSVMMFLGFAVLSDTPPLHTLAFVVGAGSICLAIVLTIVSAIVAKAQTRSAILPVLSFPLLVPVLLLGTRATTQALAGFDFAEIASSVILMLSYGGIVLVISTWLFEIIWSD